MPFSWRRVRRTRTTRFILYRFIEPVYVWCATHRWLLPLRVVLGSVLVLLTSLRLSVMDRTLAILVPQRDGWQVHDLRRGTVRHSPVAVDAYHVTRRHGTTLREAYTWPGFVSVEDGDTVFDVGAYLGGFSLAVADTAATVYSVEASPQACALLRKNAASRDNITVVERAAWNREEQLTLNRSLLPNENSLLDVDTAAGGTSVTIEADTVAGMADAAGVDTIDFLKVEAEGAEPEVLEGVLGTDTAVRKIVVDCSPERDGASPIDTVQNMLEDAGYDCRTGRRNPWDVPFVYATR